MVWNATGSLKDGALRLQTVRMYNDILKLDVGHDTAIKGTKEVALGLPPERVKEWVIAQKAKWASTKLKFFRVGGPLVHIAKVSWA